MKPERQYLMEYLQDEFRRYPQVRIRVLPVSASYEEGEGIVVRTEAREYYFPFAWVESGQFREVEALVRKIHEIL